VVEIGRLSHGNSDKLPTATNTIQSNSINSTKVRQVVQVLYCWLKPETTRRHNSIKGLLTVVSASPRVSWPSEVSRLIPCDSVLHATTRARMLFLPLNSIVHDRPFFFLSNFSIQSSKGIFQSDFPAPAPLLKQRI
jgi:hypothetical protein